MIPLKSHSEGLRLQKQNNNKNPFTIEIFK